MQRRRSHAGVCGDKHPYESRRAACVGIRELVKREGRPKRRLHAYQCPQCGAWHFGSSLNLGEKTKNRRRS